MDARTTAQRLAQPINTLGARSMLDPVTAARCVEDGLPANPLASYVQGRLGVMGDIDADAAVNSLLFFDRDYAVGLWNEDSDLSKSDSGAVYAAISAERGTHYLEGFDDAARLSELLERVADSADDTVAPLFAGWRDVTRPDDPASRAYQMVIVVRELRGDLHMAACRNLGTDPLAMVLAGSGEGTARMHGYTDLDHERASGAMLATAKEATDDLDARNYEFLTDDEWAELVTLVDAAVVHAVDR